MNGGSSGVLSPGFEVVDVPLRGPGNWTLTTSASTSQSLQCGTQTSPVLQQIVVGATQSCQLEISPPRRARRRSRGNSTEHLKGVAAPLQGMAMALYFVLLPYVVLSKWSSAVRHGNGPLLRTLLVLLALFWLIFFVQVVLNVVRLRRGSSRGQGGSAWLAGLLVAVLPFLIPAVALSTHAPHAITQPIGALADRATARHQDGRAVPTRPGVPLSLSSLGSLPMALMAKRRSDLIRQHQFVEIEHDVDETIRVLRGAESDAHRPTSTTHWRPG